MTRGEIYLFKLCNFGAGVQRGVRPVVVVQNDWGNSFADTTIVCAITSAEKQNLPTHINIDTSCGLQKDSTILCEQIFTVRKDSLLGPIGEITDKETLERLDAALKVSLDL